MPAVLNAANEETVKLFLENRVEFHQIPRIIERVMSEHKARKGSIEDYIEQARWAKQTVRSLL